MMEKYQEGVAVFRIASVFDLERKFYCADSRTFFCVTS